MPTTIKINEITMSLATTAATKNPPVTQDDYGPINFNFDAMLTDGSSTPRNSPFNLSIMAATKVPGGSGLEGPSVAGDTTVYRIFKLDAVPKVVRTRVVDHHNGSKTVTVWVILPCSYLPEGKVYSDEEKKTYREFMLENPPVDISETYGADINAEPCPNDSDMSLEFVITWPMD